jgi:hypothetical protein
MRMDEVAFHREPPSNIPTMVTALSGWIDAGEAATDAMRFLVRQLPAFSANNHPHTPAQEGGKACLERGCERMQGGLKRTRTIHPRRHRMTPGTAQTSRSKRTRP